MAEPVGVLRRIAVAVVPALVVAYATAAVVAVPRHRNPLTTYAGLSTVALAADLAAGLALLAAGVFAWLEPRERRVAALTLLAGAAWFGADWDGWDGGPSFVRSLGAVAIPLLLPLVFHLVLAYPSGRLRGRAERVAAGAAYGLVLVVAGGRALFRDPLLDLHCWRNCSDNSFLVHADPGLAHTLDRLWLFSAVAIGIASAAVAAWRIARGTPTARRVLVPVLAPALVLGAAEAAYAAALLQDPFENPARAEFASFFFIRAIGAICLAAGVAWGVARLLHARADISGLAERLGEAPQPGALRERLATALGDPPLQVAYWLPTLERYVDGDGRVIALPEASDGRSTTAIVRSGQQVAIVVHDASLRSESRLVDEIGAAARLAVDNERLHAELLAQLEDLRASQARIVETGDRERRRLERDLHDGAQQQLLALSYELRLARAAAGDADAETAALLTGALSGAEGALEELRALAYGIFPAVLTDFGLGAALETLADGSPLPVVVRAASGERYPPSVETTAYLAVAETIADAAERSATFVSVDAHPEAGRLVVTAEDDGEDGGTLGVELVDRVGALGGTLERRGGRLRVEIPCA